MSHHLESFVTDALVKGLFSRQRVMNDGCAATFGTTSNRAFRLNSGGRFNGILFTYIFELSTGLLISTLVTVLGEVDSVVGEVTAGCGGVNVALYFFLVRCLRRFLVPALV